MIRSVEINYFHGDFFTRTSPVLSFLFLVSCSWLLVLRFAPVALSFLPSSTNLLLSRRSNLSGQPLRLYRKHRRIRLYRKRTTTRHHHSHRKPEIQTTSRQHIRIVYHPDCSLTDKSRQRPHQNSFDINVIHHPGLTPDISKQNYQNQQKTQQPGHPQSAKHVQPEGIKTAGPDGLRILYYETPVQAAHLQCNFSAKSTTEWQPLEKLPGHLREHKSPFRTLNYALKLSSQP